MQPNQPYQQYANPPGQVPDYLPVNPDKKDRPWQFIIPLIALSVLFLGTTIFAIWAFNSRQQYKNESDKITAKAVALAVQVESTKKDNEFTEKEKSPLKNYKGPDAYGGLDISYPKTWAAYISQSDRGTSPIDGYFHPSYVPAVVNGGTAYALRVQVSNKSYAEELKQFESKVKSGKVVIGAYSPKNVPGVSGSRLNGEIIDKQKGSMVVIPLRDKTLKISTESQEFLGDFDNIILANLKFVP